MDFLRRITLTFNTLRFGDSISPRLQPCFIQNKYYYIIITYNY